MANNILKEAIADAKAVREVALANAKAALEEAFTPRLQSMLSAKLSEDLNEEEDLDENVEEIEEGNYYEDDPKADKKMEENNIEEGESVDLDEEIDLEEILSELELEEGDDLEEEKVEEAKEDDLDEAKKDDDKDDVKEAKDEDKDDMKEAKEEDLDEAKDDEIDEAVGYPNYKADHVQKVNHDASDVNQGLNESESFDLDAHLEEINNLDENEDEVNEVAEETNEEVETTNEVAEETNEALGTIAGIGGLIAAAGGLSAIEAASENPDFKAKHPKVAKALGMMQKLGGQASATRKMEEEAKDKELEETKAALETVTTELNEVNLLNSKLLYVNRIFKANTLDEAQKLRVVETLDNATNVKEAKLIYETIKDTFNVVKSTKTTPKRSIKEGLGMASKAAGTSTAAKKPVLNESNDMMARMQKLANIKINQ